MTPPIPRGKIETTGAETPAYSSPSTLPPSQDAQEMACFQPGAGLALGAGAEVGLEQAYSVRLFGPACLPEGYSAPLSPNRTEVEAVGISQSQVRFDSGDEFQKCVARNLQSFFTRLDLDAINQAVHGKFYDVFPVYDTAVDLAQIQEKLSDLPLLSQAQKLALGFFMYGQTLNSQEMRTLFGENTELLNQLQELNIIAAEPSPRGPQYHLNNLTLITHQLPNDEILYLLADLPTHLQEYGEVHPTAQISGTSYIMLHRLERTFREGDMDTPRGVIADFGSGIGILGLAMLKMYPDIDTALGVEIDEHSMNLSRFNAMLNGVEDRYQVVDNRDEANFPTALGNRPLDLALSNPPFNVVPASLSEAFTDFGDGGDQGLDVTKIFLNQALPVLREGGRFVAYSVLAQDASDEFLLTRNLRDMGFANLSLNFEEINLPRETYNRNAYAEALVEFLASHGDVETGPGLVRQVAGELSRSNVDQLIPNYWTIQMGGEGRGIQVNSSRISMPVLEGPYGARPQISRKALGGVFLQTLHRPGGVFESLQQVAAAPGGEDQGGVYVRKERVRPDSKLFESRKSLLEGLREFCRGKKANTPECKDLEKALGIQE